MNEHKVDHASKPMSLSLDFPSIYSFCNNVRKYTEVDRQSVGRLQESNKVVEFGKVHIACRDTS